MILAIKSHKTGVLALLTYILVNGFLYLVISVYHFQKRLQIEIVAPFDVLCKLRYGGSKECIKRSSKKHMSTPQNTEDGAWNDEAQCSII